MRKPILYILRCSDGRYYTGVTTNLAQRLLQHENGEVSSFTKSRRPVTLVFQQELPSLVESAAAEQMVKGWSQAKKEALIAGDFDRIRELARCRNESNSKNKNA